MRRSPPGWTMSTPELIMEQYDYHGTPHQWLHQLYLRPADVTVTTQGSNHIALNDDVICMYTGVTSANADQSNLGFCCPTSAPRRRSSTTPPALLSGPPRLPPGRGPGPGVYRHLPHPAEHRQRAHLFHPLKDDANLVKSYAMVNVARYDIVATGSSVTQCEQEYPDAV